MYTATIPLLGLPFHSDNLILCISPPALCTQLQGGALNRGLFFAGPPPSLLGAVSGKISEIR